MRTSMLRLNDPLLINILGHAAGALIFAIFLYLLFSGRGWSGARGRYLSGLAAILSLVWNLGSLTVLVRPGLPAPVVSAVIAISFSVLSLLPAVLLHISLERTRRPLVAAGYALSAIAIVMHFREIGGNGAKLHQAALLLITVGFMALTAIAVASSGFGGASNGAKGRGGGTRVVASMCLALFAMSFIHFGTGHASQAWSSEVLVHHAGIPLALFVLLQDYRFVLLDAFIRFLANALLAVILAWLVTDAALRVLVVERRAGEPLDEALLLMAVCLFLVFFAWMSNRVQTWLTHVVFRQDAVAELASRVRNSPAMASEEKYLDWAAATIAQAVNTDEFAVAGPAEAEAATGHHARVVGAMAPGQDLLARWKWAEALAPVRLGQGNSRLILLGRRRGGQRYLGEDLDALGKAAAEIAEKVESLRRQEMDRLVSQAELRALQSQINPHFLFNSLNALYGTIPREASSARRMALNMAEIFRYFLQSDTTFVPLAQELQIVRAYLEVEQCRVGSRLEVSIDVDDAVLQTPIPILSIQPLVENAVKHGIAQRTEPGYIRIKVESRNGELRVLVENSAGSSGASTKGTGLGLQNVRRRLEICYGPASDLRLSIEPGRAIAEICIPLETIPART